MSDTVFFINPEQTDGTEWSEIFNVAKIVERFAFENANKIGGQNLNELITLAAQLERLALRNGCYPT